jgi:hypothetical protein
VQKDSVNHLSNRPVGSDLKKTSGISVEVRATMLRALPSTAPTLYVRVVIDRRQSKRPRFRHSAEELRLAHEVLSHLSRDGSHASDWEPITDENALYGLRAGEHTRLYRQTRKGWEPIKALNGVRSEERVIALRRRRIPQRPRLIVDTGLSEAERRAHHRAIHDFFFHNQRLPTEPDPAVHIRFPGNGERVGLDDKVHTHRRLIEHEFQPGETPESVTQGLLGYPDPEAVYDADMRRIPDPRPGERPRVFAGYLLEIEGSTHDARLVEIAWSGPTQGSSRLAAGSGRGDGWWSVEIPVKPGRYRVTASIAEKTATTEFEVVETEKTLWARTVGMAKAFVNETLLSINADAIEATGKAYEIQVPGERERREVSAAEFADLIRAKGDALLPPQGEGEQSGAQWLRDNPQVPLAIGAITALGSHGKSLLRHPDEFLADLKRALTHSRSEPEALGELGMAQAHRRLGIETDPRYVNRYHGPDDIGHQNQRLTETEAKASPNDRVQVAKDNDDNRQGSKNKNRKRAEAMKKKEQQGKVGQPSNRQGGPYQEGEMEMYGEIRDRDGNKQHLLVHTNTKTGVVRAFEQINGGKIGKKLDEFKMENFEEAKSMLEKHFTKLKEQAKK